MSNTLRSVKGMNDLLPDEAESWEVLEQILREWLHLYGFRPIRTPILEYSALFSRGIGEVTDIVEKEIYAFEDRLNGDELALRPENTASCVRAAIEHQLIANGAASRLYYYGPMFRHERPQKGRYRQFHQVGAEALGFAGPDVDAELILMCQRLWQDLDLRDVALEINSIGDAPDRAVFRAELIRYFEGHADLLDEDARRRLHSNPLRILDSKNPVMQAMIENAPRLDAYLGNESRQHLDGVRRFLDDAGLEYRINHRLVRGLDYYNRTVFEWVTGSLGAQSTICGGGRYDGLVEMMGGRPTPGCGFAIGIERIMALWQESGVVIAAQVPDIYLCHSGMAAQRRAFLVAEELRSLGLTVIMHGGTHSFKAQMKRADASGAALALILGEDELNAGEITIKPLRGGEQYKQPMDGLSDHLAGELFGMEE